MAGLAVVWEVLLASSWEDSREVEGKVAANPAPTEVAAPAVAWEVLLVRSWEDSQGVGAMAAVKARAAGMARQESWSVNWRRTYSRLAARKSQSSRRTTMVVHSNPSLTMVA